MKKSKFSEAQVAAALRECASGTPVGQVARKLGVSEQTLYAWKKRYVELPPSDRTVFRLKERGGIAAGRAS
jgi:transposase-like protein